MDIGKKIFQIRKAHKLSQKDLAQALGTCQQHISQWENNKRIININELLHICDYFNISINSILCDTSPSHISSLIKSYTSLSLKDQELIQILLKRLSNNYYN